MVHFQVPMLLSYHCDNRIPLRAYQKLVCMITKIKNIDSEQSNDLPNLIEYY